MSALGQKRTHSCSFDHLVGAQKEHLQNFEVERLNGREIDDKLEFGRCLYRKIGRLVAARDTVDLGRQRLCRTSPSAPHMSAFGGKADIPFCIAHVGF